MTIQVIHYEVNERTLCDMNMNDVGNSATIVERCVTCPRCLAILATY